MNALKKGFSFYVFGNIHVALAVYSLVKLTLLQYGIHSHYLAYFSFFGTIISYNLIRYFQLEKLNTGISIWMKSNKKSLIFLNFFAVAGSLYFLSQFDKDEFLMLIPLVLATVFYVLPFKSGRIGLRAVPMLKLLLISFIWASLTVVLPLISSSDHFSEKEWLIFGQRLLFVLAITIPFDIRDANFDDSDLVTLPQLIGIRRSKIFATIALLISVYVSYEVFGLTSINFLLDTIIMMLSILFVLFTNPNRPRYYTAFWVESIPVIWYFLYLLLIE